MANKEQKTMGFLISSKNNELRRALLPEDISKIKNKSKLVFESGYGKCLGFDDADYIAAGAKIDTRENVLKCDILVDVKLDSANYLNKISNGKTLVGWAHATQQVEFAGAAMKGGHTIIAWEEIYEGGRYIFYRNREIAGEAAIMHGFRYSNKMPYDANVCVVGNGQTAKGALRVLHGLGTKNLDIYPRKFEKLFREKMFDYDVIVNCVMWDTTRTDRLIYKEELKKFKPGSLIIDVTCNINLEVETTRPTTIDDPVYTVDGIVHYAVDNTPAMYPHTVTLILSSVFANYVDEILESKYSKPVENAIVIKEGKIVSEEIRKFREKRNLFVQ
ncbi:MAG: N(5)-(carboxyethyl)ornithine synthase [Firmicutes bacterium]|nr:N(5)-(carboxyethyl)ornithine synthase [Bacillota bacterium]